MANEVTDSLFGITPEAYRRAQDAQLQKEALAYAQLDPMQRAAMGMYTGASRLGSAVGGMLGGTDPELQLVRSRQQAVRSADLSTPQGYKQLASTLLSSGDYAGAQEAMAKATAMEKAALEAAKTQADTAKANADAIKALRPETTNEMKNAASIASAKGLVVDSPEWVAEYNTQLLNLTRKAPNISEIGVAMGTNAPVYLDKDNNQQFVYITDKDGKQVRQDYTGGVDRTTAKVSASSSSKGADAGAEAAAKLDAAAVDNARTASFKASEQAGVLQAMYNTPQPIAGTGAAARVAALRVFDTVGLASSADKAALGNADIFNALAGERVLSFIKNLGVNPTDTDREFARNIGPALEKGTKTNKDLINYLMQRARDTVAQADALETHFYNNNYSLKGFKSPLLKNLQPPQITTMSADDLAAKAGGKIVNGKFVKNK